MVLRESFGEMQLNMVFSEGEEMETMSNKHGLSCNVRSEDCLESKSSGVRVVDESSDLSGDRKELERADKEKNVNEDFCQAVTTRSICRQDQDVPSELIIDSYLSTIHGGTYAGHEYSPRLQQIHAREFDDCINGKSGKGSRVIVDSDDEFPVFVALDENIENALAKGVVLQKKDKSYTIDWKMTFLGIGIKETEAVLNAFGLRKGAPKDQEAIGILYRILSGQPISIVRLASCFTEDKRQRLLRLALNRNLFPMDAAHVAEIILGRRKSNDHDAERTLYLLSVCRKRGFKYNRSFVDEVFAEEMSCIPSVYDKFLQKTASQVKAVCNSSIRPSILLKFPEGAPSDEIAVAIAKATSPDRSYGLLDGNVSSGLDVVGTHAGYSNAMASRYTEVLAATTSMTYVITNIHHLSSISKNDGDPVGYVRQLLNSSTYPKDAFVDASLIMDGALIVVTESSNTKHSDFESQCDLVINIPSLARDEKILAAEELLAACGIAVQDNETIARLVDEHAYDSGIAMLRSSINILVEHADQLDGVLAEQDILRLLPSPDAEDERYLLARNRQSLERMGERHIAVAEKLLDAVLEERKTGECIERDAAAKLRLLCRAAPKMNERLIGNYDSLCFDILKTHPGISRSTVRQLCSAIITSVRNANHVRALLLVGPAGVGKTTLVKSVADSLGVQIAKRDMSSLSPGELFGSIASPSSFTEIAATNDGRPMVFLLDEVDKMSPQLCDSSTLCSLLDQAIVTDCYLNLSMDFSNNLFILTANDLTNISDYILNRVLIVTIDGYTPVTKKNIARFIMERKAEEMRAEAPNVDSDAFDWLVQLDDEAGLRKLEARIETIISTSEGQRVTKDDVTKQFPKPCLPESNGIKVVMPREGAKGGAASASITFVKRESNRVESIITTDAFKRSLNIAEAACRYALDMENVGGICALEELDDIDKTYSPCSELGIAAAIYSAQKNLTIANDTAFLGALSLSGSVLSSDDKAIRKAPFIISRAHIYQVESLICPENFANNEEAMYCAEREGVKLIGVNSLNEAIRYVQGKAEIDQVLRELSC